MMAWKNWDQILILVLELYSIKWGLGVIITFLCACDYVKYILVIFEC